MRKNRLALALALAFPCLPLSSVWAQEATASDSSTKAETPVKSLGVVTITGGQPTSLPTQIPATIEGVTKEQIEETINATDSEDALKYFPSLLVRKRYIGDYNHAVLSSRASGTGNSARSAVYADGILLSNYLGNGATYTPRWGMVTPEEIERVDVMYGPYSAAYPGNSVGAVVDYVTRMPTQFEGSATASVFQNNFKLYNTDATYGGTQGSASLGSRNNDWSWWVNLNHSDSTGQPLVFATKATSATTATAGTAVTGAPVALSTTNSTNYILGTTTQYHTVQDHAKIKLAYDITSTLRASYTLGYWVNNAEGNPQTYLRDASGNAVYYGVVQINGQNYDIGNPFSATRESLMHVMHGLSLKTNTKDVWDWEVAASMYDYAKDQVRSGTFSSTTNYSGGAGTLTDQKGTGWTTVLARGTWRPSGPQGKHIVDFGAQQDNYRLHIVASNTSNWLSSDPSSVKTDVGGSTQTQALYGQDTWRFAERWKTVLGARVENWSARDGFTYNSAATGSKNVSYDSRNETYVSPKASLAYQWAPETVLKLASGRAVRMPTVSELYGATTSSQQITYVNDPNLAPEKSITTEVSVEQDFGNGLLRTTVFNEDTRDALYSQLISGSTTVSRVQNVDAVNTKGVEIAYNGMGVFVPKLDFSGSVTYADSKIVSNPTLASSEGKLQPRVPDWRATMLMSYRFDEQQSGSFGVRYSGKQYSQLNNSDVNGYAYQGASEYLVVDIRYRYRITPKAVASLGVDNLTDQTYWNFHPYPQRTYIADLKVNF